MTSRATFSLSSWGGAFFVVVLFFFLRFIQRLRLRARMCLMRGEPLQSWLKVVPPHFPQKFPFNHALIREGSVRVRTRQVHQDPEPGPGRTHADSAISDRFCLLSRGTSSSARLFQIAAKCFKIPRATSGGNTCNYIGPPSCLRWEGAPFLTQRAVPGPYPDCQQLGGPGGLFCFFLVDVQFNSMWNILSLVFSFKRLSFMCQTHFREKSQFLSNLGCCFF